MINHPEIYFKGLANSYYLPFFLGVFGLFIFVYRLQRKYLKVLIPLNNPIKTTLFQGIPRFGLKCVLSSLSLLLLACALLRPAWGQKPVTYELKSRDILIVLDVSRSMAAQDTKPDRLSFAKEKIKRLLSHLEADQVGLVVFSSQACVYCPMTNDYVTFFSFLDQVQIASLSSGTTSIEQGLLKAMDLFERSSSETSKLVVLMTDGEDFSQSLQQVKQKVEEQNMVLFVMGFGSTEGSPIPTYDENGAVIGHLKDEHGKVVISRLNEPLLKSLSQRCGGLYKQASDNDTDVKTIAEHLKSFEQKALGKESFNEIQDQYPWFSAAALLFLLIEALL